MLPGIFQFCDTRKNPRCKLIGANGKDFGISVWNAIIDFGSNEKQLVKSHLHNSTFNFQSWFKIEIGSVNRSSTDRDMKLTIRNAPCSINRIISRIYF